MRNSARFLRKRGGGPLTQGHRAANIGSYNFYTGHYPFVNVLLVCNGFYNFTGAGTASATTGWVSGLGAGQSCRLNICNDMDAFNGFFPPGNYKLVSTSAATLSVLGNANITSAVSGVGVCTFTVNQPAPGAWNTLTVQVQFTNATGAPIDINDCACYLVSEEAAFLADPWAFKESFLEDLRGCNLVRFMDWTGTNGSPRYDISEYGPQNRGGTPCFQFGTPFSICAKLAKELGAVGWFCTPQASKQRAYTYTAATSTFTAQSSNTGTGGTAHGFVNNERVMAYGYDGGNTAMAPLGYGTVLYVRNPTTTTFQLSTTSGGAPIALTDGVDRLQADFSYSTIASLDTNIETLAAQIAAVVYAEAPNINVLVEHSNEVWNFGFAQFRHAQYAMAYLATGVLAQNAPAGYAYGTLKTWKGWETVFPSAQVFRVFAGQAAGFGNLAGPAFEYVDPGILNTGMTVKAICAANLSRSVYATAPYIVGNNGTVSRPSINQIYLDNGSTTSIPDSYWDACWRRGITTAIGQMNDSITNARIKVPGILCTTYEYGIDWFLVSDASPHLSAIGNNGFAWLDGLQGKNMYRDAYSALIALPGFQHQNQYWSCGGYTARNGFWQQWPLKARQGNANDTLRSAWFKTL